MDRPEDRKPAVPPAGDTAPRDQKVQGGEHGGDASKSALDARIARCLRLFMEDPAGLPAFRSAEDLLKEAQAWEKLLTLYDRRIEAIANPVERANLLARKGHLLERYLSRPDDAAACYRAAMVAHPVQADAQRRLASFLETEERWDELADLLEASASQLQGAGDRGAIYLRLAELCTTHLDREETAIDCFKQALALEPERRDLFDGLCDLLERLGRLEALAGVVEAQAEREEAGGDLLARAAALWTGPLSETPGAIDRAVACHERIIALGDACLDTGRSRDVLVDLYRKTGRWEALVEALQALPSTESDPGASLREAADILETRLDDPARALEVWRDLLDHKGGDAEALAACERLARAARDQATLAEILNLRNEAGLFESEAEAIAVNEERAEIAAAIGESDEEVARALEAVLALDPDRQNALVRLCDIYDRLDRPIDRARKLMRLAEALPSMNPPRERGEAWRDAAQALEAIGETESATAAYEKARTFLCDDLFVLARLQALHDSLGNIADACAAAEAELSLLCGDAPERPGRDPERERILIERLAADASGQGRSDEALALWQALLERNPDHHGALEGLAAIFEKSDDDEGLLSILLKKSQIEETPGRKIDLLLRTGKLYETACLDPEEAVSCYEQACGIDPDCTPALDALQDLYPSLARWPAQAALLARRASLAEGEARADFGLARARVLRDHLSDEDSARSALEEVLGVSPDCVDALQDLADLHRSAERWRALETILAREEEITTALPRGIALAEERARLWEGPLGDPDQAAAIWKRLVEIAPDHPGARERLAAYHRAAGRWADVAGLLEDALRHEPPPDRALALHAELAAICEERLARTDQALVHYRHAARLAPDDPAMREGLHRSLARAEAWEEQIALLRAEAGRDQEIRPYGWADALVEIARIHEEALDDPETAEQIFREILAAVPEHEAAQRALFRRLEGSGDLEALARLISSSLKICEDPDRRIVLAREALRVALTREKDSDGAGGEIVAACKRLITLGAEDDGVLCILASRLEDAGRFKELLDTLSMRLVAAEAREVRLDVSLRLAALWENRFSRPDRALEIYRQAVQIDHACLPALRAMVRLCEKEGRWEELLRICETLLREDPDPARRAAVMLRMAIILHERFERDHDAIGNLERCLGLDPSNADACDLLEMLTRKHLRYRTLVRILRERIEASGKAGEEQASAGSPDTEIAARWEELGDVLNDHLGEPHEAAEAYRHAFAQAVEPSARRLAGLKVEKIHAQLDDADALRGFYPTLLEALGDPKSGAEPEETAGVWARYGDLLAGHAASTALETKAAEAYNHARELDPRGALRFEAQQRLLQRTGAQAELAGLLEEGAACEEVATTAARLSVEAGDAWTAAGSVEAAEKAYRRALDYEPSTPAFECLGRLLAGQDRMADLAALREEQIAIAESAEEERAIRLEAAALLRDLPGRSAQSLTHYRRALELGPPSGEILRAIADLSLLTGDESGAVMALERYLDVPPPREDLVWTLSTLARLWEKPLGRAARAAAYCRMWLEAEPGSGDARDRLERLAEERREWRELAELLEARCAGRAPEVTRRLRRLAGIYEERLADPERALGTWTRLLAVEPDAPDALAAIADRAPGFGRWRDAASALKRLITRTPDPKQRRAHRLRLAGILADHASETPHAIDHLYAVLEEEPLEEEAVRARDLLCRLLDREGRFEEIFELLEETLKGAEEDAKAPLFAAMGEIAERRLWRAPEAARAYEAWLAIEPGNEACIHKLAGLYGRLGRWSDLKEILSRERALDITDDRRLAIALALAEIAERRLRSPAAAAAELETALSIAPEQTDAITSLCRLYRDLGDHEALHRTIHRELALPAAADRVALLHIELARLESGPLGRPEDAIGSYESALRVTGTPAALLDELAGLYERLGRHRDLLATLNRLAEIAEGDDALSSLYVRMGQACERASEITDAISCFERAAALTPKLPAALAGLRRLYECSDNWQGAAAAIEMQMDCAPDPGGAAELAVAIAEIFEERLNDPQAADAWCERAIELDAGCRSAHAWLGTRQFATGDFETACAYLRSALALEGDPAAREETALLAFRLGVSAARIGNADEAILALRKAIRLRPDLVEGWEELGRIYVDSREWRSAVDALGRVANTKDLPEERRMAALHGLAIAESAQEDFEAALTAVNDALAIGSDEFDLRAIRAEALSALGKDQRASEAWRLASDVAPDGESRGECLFRGAVILDTIAEEGDRAIAWLRESLAAHPGHIGALRRLADHGLEKQSWEEAKSCLVPLCELREAWRDHADLGRVWWEGFGEEQRALVSLRAAMALPGAGIDAANLAVAICAERENWPRLAAVIQGYLAERELSAEHIPLLEQLAAVYAGKLYETEAAAEALRAVVNLSPADPDGREALVAVLSKNAETHAEAVEVCRDLIAASPLRASAWRNLAELYWFGKRLAGCRYAAEVVRMTGGSTDESPEDDPLPSFTSVEGATAASLFAAGSPARVALGEPALLDSLKSALQDDWTRLCPPAPDAAGKAGDWPGVRGSALKRALIFWDIPDTQVVPLGEGDVPLRALWGRRVAIGVQETLIRDLSGPVWDFYCHRVASQIVLGHGPVASLDAGALGDLLAALRNAAAIDVDAPAEPFEQAASRVVSWRNRRRVRKALEGVGSPDSGELARYVEDLAESADRAALMASGDLPAALLGIASLARGGSGFNPERDPLPSLVEASPRARRLLVFVSGERFLAGLESAAGGREIGEADKVAG